MHKIIVSLRMLLPALLLVAVGNHANAAIHWVGTNTPACQAAANHHTTISAALLSAAFSAENDEIRLTNTLSYTGNGGVTTFTDFHPGSSGSLVFSGGYADCNTAQSGRTLFGGNSGTTFTVETVSQSTSVVTFRNIEVANATGLAFHTKGGAEVTLNNVWIHNNGSGISVDNGPFVDILANTVIEQNFSGGGWGAGIVCIGANSLVNIAGRLTDNRAGSGNGGNIYAASGCFVELKGGSVIEGNGVNLQAANGGGIYIDNGGELFANGGQSRVVVRSNSASNGGGLFLNGSGRATLLNTILTDNWSGDLGSAIYAIGGGLVNAQLTMDRVAPCPFIISCSEIDQSRPRSSVVYANNTLLLIQRTTMERADAWVDLPSVNTSMVFAENGAIVRLNSINMTRNNLEWLLIAQPSSEIYATHITMADNSAVFSQQEGLEDSFIGLNVGTMRIENSIMIDTRGMDNRGGFVSGKCNLVNDGTDLPAGSFFIDTPSFFDKPGGDYRQNAHSTGVDTCLQDTFSWSTERDLGFQIRPVNEGTNPSGMPGETDGKYDAGYFEAYINVAEDFFDLTVALAGEGGGEVISHNVTGITCEPDCSETYDQGITVILLAIPMSGHSVSWSGCDVLGGNQCAVTMNSNINVIATFTPPDPGYIFGDGFE